MARQIAAGLLTQEPDFRIAALQLGPLRPVSNDHLGPREFNSRNASRFFSTATRPMVMKMGLGESSSIASSGVKGIVSNSARPAAKPLKPRPPSSCLSEAVAIMVMVPAA